MPLPIECFAKETDLNDGKVGLYFYVDNDLLAEPVDLERAENYGDFKIGRSSHYSIWEKKYASRFEHAYDYYPRGRVVYHIKLNQFTVYADRCIDAAGITKILQEFQLENKKIFIDRTDIHYVCSRCSDHYYE